MIRKAYVGLFLAAISAAVVASIVHHHHSKQRAIREEATRFEAAIREATQIGNTVVSARELSGNAYVLRVLSAKESKASSPAAIPDFPGAASTNVVLVHGYNTSFANAVANGNELWEAIRLSLGSDISKTVRFFTFCWRGDFGALRFTKSNESAKKTAPVFGSFLKQIASISPLANQSKLIVVTHSLGALVALESLRQMQDKPMMPLVDILLMVQPAVQIDDLGRANIRSSAIVFQSRGKGPVAFSEPREVDLPPYANNGVYFDTITKATRDTFATASGTDGVLGFAFSAWATKVIGYQITTYPTTRTALGSPLHGGWEFPPNLHPVDLSPRKHLGASIRTHGDLFDPKNQALVQFLMDTV